MMRTPDSIPELEIVRAYILVQAYADAVVPGHGIDTFELHLLHRLRGEPPMSQAELGRRILRDPMSVSRLVRGLEQRGLVQRVASPEDARAKLLTLTPRAEALVTGIFEEIDRGEPMRGWSKRDLQALVGLLRRASDSLREACQRAGISAERTINPATARLPRRDEHAKHLRVPARERMVRADDEEPLPRAPKRRARRLR